MKLQLEEPFRSLYECGYTYVDSENRKRVNLVLNGETVNNITYARYLMCVKIGYILPTELEVDHKDNDKTNDDINNLQILTKEDNLLKQEYHYVMNQVNYGFHCANCLTPFILTEREVNMRLKQKVEMAFCNRSCATNYHSFFEMKIKEQKVKEAKDRGLNITQISIETGFSRNTVSKYFNS